MFSLFNVVTCSSFLKALADAHRSQGKTNAALMTAQTEEGSDMDMEDAEDKPSRGEGDVAATQALCAEAIQNMAAVLPLLSLKDQQDSLRK